jgi:hypothetical protein
MTEPQGWSPTHEPVIHAGEAAIRRLQQLGINPDRLFDALDAGDVAARQADVFSPVNAAGMLRWLETVRALRQGLAADGWTTNDDRNSPRIVDPGGAIALLPVSGTVDVGLESGEPKTANARGNTSARAVQVNGQLEFSVTVALLADLAAEKTNALRTWFLLYYRTQSEELRAELSLPVGISDLGVVDAWRERILLPSRQFGAEQEILPRDAGDNDDGIDFSIAAR